VVTLSILNTAKKRHNICLNYNRIDAYSSFRYNRDNRIDSRHKCVGTDVVMVVVMNKGTREMKKKGKKRIVSNKKSSNKMRKEIKDARYRRWRE